MNIDGGMVYSPAQFEVVENPKPTAVSPNSSIVAGGIPIRIEFGARSRVDCVQKLSLILQSVSRVNGEGDCIRAGTSLV